MFEHGTRVVGSEVAGLGAEVEEDGIRFPAAKGMDGSLVDAGDEKGGGTPGSETVSFNLFRRNVSDVVDGGSSVAELVGDLERSDIMGALGGVVVAVEGAVGGCMVLEEMVDMALDGADRAESGIARDAMTEGFPMGAVLLISVGERHVGPMLHVIPRTSIGRDALDGGTAEGSVSEMEGLTLATIGGRERAHSRANRGNRR